MKQDESWLINTLLYLKSKGRIVGLLATIAFFVIGTCYLIMPASTTSIEFPKFPWPPPAWSCKTQLDLISLKGKKLKDIGFFLIEASKQADYIQASYYWVPNGFALVLEFDQFDNEGKPLKKYRRTEKVAPQKELDLLSYLISLIKGDSGNFRIIVFIVTDAPLTSNKIPSFEEAKTWASTGFDKLPDTIGENYYQNGYNCSVLIYHFYSQNADAKPKLIKETLSPQEHLKKCQIWDKLGWQ